jgi:3-hydroxyacyl-[acyl-carrier-protein] dehydratase
LESLNRNLSALKTTKSHKECDVGLRDPLIDLSTIDFEHVVADIDEIRQYNPQRYEMEQLTAIVRADLSEGVCVGYRDLTEDEFWIRGHFPNMPVMPGVIMCEAAAQLCSYFTQKFDLLGAEVVGFGGLEDVRFFDPVRPGERFVVIAKQTKLRRGAVIVCRFQGWVDDRLVVNGAIKGIPLPIDKIG